MKKDINPCKLERAQIEVVSWMARAEMAHLEIIAGVDTLRLSFRRLADAQDAGIAKDVAEHPDLAWLNVQLDGFYGEEG